MTGNLEPILTLVFFWFFWYGLKWTPLMKYFDELASYTTSKNRARHKAKWSEAKRSKVSDNAFSLSVAAPPSTWWHHYFLLCSAVIYRFSSYLCGWMLPVLQTSMQLWLAMIVDRIGCCFMLWDPQVLTSGVTALLHWCGWVWYYWRLIHLLAFPGYLLWL